MSEVAIGDRIRRKSGRGCRGTVQQVHSDGERAVVTWDSPRKGRAVFVPIRLIVKLSPLQCLAEIEDPTSLI